MGFRITTWNVNGIRNPFGYQPWRDKRTFEAMFEILESDIVVMQETKIQRKDLRDDMVLVPGWDVYFSLPRHKKGYSGVAIYTRNATCAPIRAEEGITGCLTAPKSTTSFRDLPEDQRIGGYPTPGQLEGKVDETTLDSEGRCVILEFPAFVLLGVYSPANRDETRDDFRIEYLQALDVRIRNLVALGKQVILTGDLNVSRSPLDSSNVLETLRKEGISTLDWISTPSRRLFNQLLFEGVVHGDRDEGREHPVLWDLCRYFHPSREGMNTCWDTKKNTRPANVGSRIDYVLCSDGLKRWFTHSDIQEGLMGSDHCPVYATFADSLGEGDQRTHIHDLVNPPGTFKSGLRQREWTQKDLLPLSAKLIPEFDRRQSIRDMFSRQASQPRPTWPAPATPHIVDQPQAKPNEGQDAKTLRNPNNNPTTHQKTQRAAVVADFRPKRTLEGITGAGKPKRPKLASETSVNAKSNVKKTGQATLKGFFKPKNVGTTPAAEHGNSALANSTAISSPVQPTSTLGQTVTSTSPQDGQGGINPSHMTPSPPRQDSATHSPLKIFDPIEAKESWSKLLGKRAVPRCEHDEECISLVTKKPGVNCGRSFYICGRPLGPSGEKEKDTEWRCGTFIWSSDWGRNG